MVALIAVTAACVAFARPVSATTTGGGALVALGTITRFPCAGAIPCTGSANGTLALSLSGVGTSLLDGVSTPYTAEWAANNDFASGFTTQDWCPVTGVPSPQGIGQGTFTLSGGTVTYPGGILVNATLNGSMAWARVGTGLTISLSNLVISGGPGATSLDPLSVAPVFVGTSPGGFAPIGIPGQCPGGVDNANISLSSALVEVA